MKPRIVVISGPVGSGKTTLAARLADRMGARHIKTRELLQARVESDGGDVARDRVGLQQLGDQLDAETEGAWVAQAIAEQVATSGDDLPIVVDGVRKSEQIRELRNVFGRSVVHLHLDAPVEELSARYDSRRETGSEVEEVASYTDVVRNPTEAAISHLAADADVAIDTKRCSPDDVEIRAAAELGLFGRGVAQCVDVLVGGQYGSEGKGNIAFYLAPEYDLLVRVGGPNAGHTVPMPTPFVHRSLPSGTFANQRATLLIGAGAVIDLEVLLSEIAACEIESGRLFIDGQAMIIEKCDVNAEGALVESIGSTGRGVGAATARRVLGRAEEMVSQRVRLAKDVRELAPYVRKGSEVLEETYAVGGRILLEGTQGTALSLFHGSYPHVTSRDTTVAGCLAEAGIAPSRLRRSVLVCRTYPIRVGDGSRGTSGPMQQQLTWDDIAERSGIPVDELSGSEKGSVSGKERRVSEFDWQLLRRSVGLNGATDIALTFADYLNIANRDARRFDQLTDGTLRFIEGLERVAGVPVSLIGTRFEVRSVIDRRQW